MTRAALALWRREVLGFLRDRARVAGVVAQPILFWLLFGFGFEGAVVVPGSDGPYLQYLLPGAVALTLLFTAIYATISVVEDRQSGVLQAALVAPQPRLAIVLGVVLGGATLAVGQGALVALLAPFVGFRPGLAGAAVALGAAVLLAVQFTALGFVFAWRLKTTRAYHAVMNVLLLPIWLLSGSFFPASGAPAVLRLVMQANPATYGVALLRYGLHGLPGSIPGTAIGAGLAAVVSGTFAVLLLALAVTTARRPLY